MYTELCMYECYMLHIVVATYEDGKGVSKT